MRTNLTNFIDQIILSRLIFFLYILKVSVVIFSLRVVSNFGTVHTAEGGVVLSGDQRWRRGGTDPIIW